MNDLTKREQQALTAIIGLYDTLKFSPTVQEIAQEMGLSKSTAFTYLERLEKKGYIERKESSPRALKIMRRA